MPASLDDAILSQLADGELAQDETVATLLAALDSEESRGRLRKHLQLRQMTSAWRAQKPTSELAPPAPPAASTPLKSPPLKSPGGGRSHGQRTHGMNFLAASVAGGLLVALGVWMGRSSHVALVPFNADVGMQALAMSASQRQQIAQVFAFHESVAGPLKCYATDDKAVEVAPADPETQSARPLAVVLRLTADGSPRSAAHEYVIVCRQGVPVAIPLPHGDSTSPRGRLYLSPVVDREGVGLSYSLTMDDSSGKSTGAAITGQRNVGNDLRSLGEVALGDRLVHVEASAWPLDKVAMP
jgi:hypothetical protein